MPRKSRSKLGRTSRVNAKVKQPDTDRREVAPEKQRPAPASSTQPDADSSDARIRLKHLICEAIAQGTPFSFQDISNAYEILGSFDLVLTACDYAASASIRLNNVIDVLMLAEGAPRKWPAKTKLRG